MDRRDFVGSLLAALALIWDFFTSRKPKATKPVRLAQSESAADYDAFGVWTCIFPGKHGICWKRAWHGSGTRAEAEVIASKNCNVVAVPLQLFEHLHDLQRVPGYEQPSA